MSSMPGNAERLTQHHQKEILDHHSLIITMDGSTTAGKRIIAERLAERYDLTMLNTGVTIRSLALLAIENGIVETDENNVTRVPVDFSEQISDMFDAMRSDFYIDKPLEGSRTARHMYGEREMRGELLTYPKQKAIDNLSSMIAASPVVRNTLYDFWRSAVKDLGGTIVVGRLTGVDLFPDAKVKLFLFASPEASAEYRVLHDPKAKKVAESEEHYVRARDAMDRQLGLLDWPVGGLIIDTSPHIRDLKGMNALESRIEQYIDQRHIIR